jgi:glycosyltransferase involved in cell wall biosynthesis
MQNGGGMEIVYFGNDWFAENRTSSHHIARRLSQRFPLLYVEVPGLRAPKADARDARKIFRKLSIAFQPPKSLGPRLWHMTVPQIPFRGLPLVGAANLRFGVQRVKAALRTVGFRRPLLWFTVPHPGHFAGRLGEDFRVYYCNDNYSALPDVDRARVAELDANLTRRADLVFVCSQTLLAAKQPLNPNTIYSPHGVDTELFGRAQTADPPAEGARALPHPVIGMHGVIDDRMDLDLVAALAKARPRWTFLLIGRVAAEVGALRSLPNVVLAGAVPYETLPDWARAYDASIMPYRPGAFAENANPLKLREYLACGKPVVSIPMPSVEPFRGLVQTAAGPEEFLAALETALATDSAAATQARMRAVERMSWDARVEEVIEIVQKHRNATG